jgi:8-oxo-dGTP pyrophosphatase MutT (NUDIX family)
VSGPAPGPGAPAAQAVGAVGAVEAPRSVESGWERLHADAVARLEAWTAPDDRQERLRAEFLRHLHRYPDAMRKSGPPAHLTGSVIVLDEAGEATLLTHHRRAGLWFQLGGHYEAADASVWHAAMREAREESGVAHITPLPEIAQLDRHILHGDFGTCREHLDIRFVAVAPGSAGPSVSSESIDVRWWPVNSLPADTRDELGPLVEAGLRLLRR